MGFCEKCKLKSQHTFEMPKETMESYDSINIELSFIC